MLRIINLLNQKNHFLEKFYSLNEAELLNFTVGQFENLEAFYQSREKLIGLIKYLDEEIEKASTENYTNKENYKLEIKEAMAIKDEYVNRILAQDLEILACIESAKSNIIKELQDIKKNKKAVGSYKSKSFQRRLDEKV